MTVSRWILVRMRNVSDKSCREHQNAHFVFNNVFRKPCLLWDNVESVVGIEVTGDNVIRRMRFAFWVSKATCAHAHAHVHALAHPLTHALAHARTHTHTEKYVIVTAFPWQQWFPKLVRITLYVHCVYFYYVLLCFALYLFSSVSS